ncbi:MAG: hypothetical protein ACI9F9_001340 [Candidatus Paceibacteria bacterium]
MSDPFQPHSPQPPADGQDTWQEVVGGFPRHLTTQLIDDESASRSRRELGACWLVGLALMLFALARPQERLLAGAGIENWRGIGIGDACWRTLAKTIADSWGVAPEMVGLIVSAVFYGACLPIALVLGRQLGLEFRLALPVSLVILLAPGAWTAATTAGTGSVALLTGLLLMRELWREGPYRVWPVVALWALASLLDVGMAWTLPAIWLALASRQKNWKLDVGQAPVTLLAAGLAGYLLFAGPFFDSNGSKGALAVIKESYFFDFSAHWSSPMAWAIAALAALGLALFGPASLFFLRRNHAESAPPRWLLAWILFPALGCALCASAPFGYSFIWLFPPALIGVLDLSARQDQPSGSVAVPLALGLQTLGLWGVLSFLSAGDPLREWRASASQVLEAGDWVLSTEADHLYLLERRWGLDALLVDEETDWSALLEQAQQHGSLGTRLVVDRGNASILTDEWVQRLSTQVTDMVEIKLLDRPGESRP